MWARPSSPGFPPRPLQAQSCEPPPSVRQPAYSSAWCSRVSAHYSRLTCTSSICSSAACRPPFHFPPFFLPTLRFLGLPFGHPPPKTFLALLAFEKCSAPCNASVLAPPFFPMALAAAERGLGFLGFFGICSQLYNKILHTFADVLFFDFTRPLLSSV